MLVVDELAGCFCASANNRSSHSAEEKSGHHSSLLHTAVQTHRCQQLRVDHSESHMVAVPEAAATAQTV